MENLSFSWQIIIGRRLMAPNDASACIVARRRLRQAEMVREKHKAAAG